tara:strand:- start:6774 stop:7046 length:273 start_codon:yes stop_codon:yes gene_type:complete
MLLKKLYGIGMTGFEPAALRSQSECATKLRYIPTLHILSNQPNFVNYLVFFVVVVSQSTVPRMILFPFWFIQGARFFKQMPHSKLIDTLS